MTDETITGGWAIGPDGKKHRAAQMGGLPMTPEIKPEDVKLPEPFAVHELWGQNVDVFTADQVRAAVLEAKAQERERCAKLCEARYMGDNNREDTEARACAAAIRAGHSIDVSDNG